MKTNSFYILQVLILPPDLPKIPFQQPPEGYFAGNYFIFASKNFYSKSLKRHNFDYHIVYIITYIYTISFISSFT